MLEYVVLSIGACLIALPLLLPSEDPKKLSRNKGLDGEYLVIPSKLPDAEGKISRVQLRGKYFLACCRLVWVACKRFDFHNPGLFEGGSNFYCCFGKSYHKYPSTARGSE